MTGSRAGTQSEETLYVQGTKARDHLFALELRPSPALTGPGAIRYSRSMPTEEPTPQSSPRRLPFPIFRPVLTYRLPFLLPSHHRRRVNDALCSPRHAPTLPNPRSFPGPWSQVPGQHSRQLFGRPITTAATSPSISLPRPITFLHHSLSLSTTDSSITTADFLRSPPQQTAIGASRF